MAYDPNVPQAANQVRSASGDLAKMQENFSLLSGAAVKGISGLIGVNADSPVSGEALIHDGSNWVPSGVVRTLSGLTDTDVAGAASGEYLALSGNTWVPSGVTATLSGLIDTAVSGVVSGEALVHDGSNWVPSGITIDALNDIGDVNVSGATAGQLLSFDGSNWIPSGTGFANAACTVSAGTSQEIPKGASNGDSTPTIVTGFEQQFVGTGFSITTTGITIDSDAIEKVNIRAQVHWVVDTTISGVNGMQLLLNGSGLENISGYGLGAMHRVRAGNAASVPRMQVAAFSVPVSSGDVIQVGAHQFISSGANNLISGTAESFIYVEDASRVSAGGGGIGDWVMHATMASGGTFSVADLTLTTISGVNTVKKNTGGFTLNSGTITVPTASGYTHVKVSAYLAWAASTTGLRELSVEKDGQAGILDTDGSTVLMVLDNRQAPNPTAGGNTNLFLASPLIPVSGGDTFTIRGQQGSGGALNAVGGAAVEGALTSLHIQAYKLS